MKWVAFSDKNLTPLKSYGALYKPYLPHASCDILKRVTHKTTDKPAVNKEFFAW